MEMTASNPSWSVLLIGGNSGSGKTTLAKSLSRRFDMPWLQVDDFRLMLEHNLSARQAPDLHHFDDLTTVYQKPPDQLAEMRIATARATSAAIEVVVANHATFGGPAILEGDDLVPMLATLRAFAGTTVEPHAVKAVFLIETNEDSITFNMKQRDRGFTSRSPDEQRTQSTMSRRYGEWLTREAERLELPVHAPRPWETLMERVVQRMRAGEQ